MRLYEMLRNLRPLLFILFSAATLIVSCQKSEDPNASSSPPTEQEATVKITSVPAELGYDPFYKKRSDLKGFSILSSDKVSDKAHVVAHRTISMMLAKDERLIPALIENKIRLAIMSPDEKTTDIPEHSDLTPKEYWDKRARGLGPTASRPAVSCAEENVLRLDGDRYEGEDILVHEFAHAIHLMAINKIDPDFDQTLKTTYEKAIKKGLWKNTYAAENHREYWAEGVQAWFDCDRESATPDGVHNHINTRKELKKYDPELYKLISQWFNIPPKEWKGR